MLTNKIYIAGPMSGIKDYNAGNFYAASDYFEGIGWEVFNPITSEASILTQAGELRGQQAYRECLFTDLEWICKHATHIYFLSGWEKSLGSKSEHATAVALGLKILYEQGS